MEFIALVVRVVIAATFFLAAAAKLRNLQGAQKAVRDFGVPNWIATPVGALLPFAEFAVAVLLILPSTVLWGGLAAAALLLLFIVGISVNLILGRTPECNCFGQLHSKPIGWPTLVRNFILVGGAALVCWQDLNGSSISVIAWAGRMPKADLIGVCLGLTMLVAVSGGGWLFLILMRQNGRLLLRLDALETQIGASRSSTSKVVSGLPIGVPAPTFKLQSLSGTSELTLDILQTEKKPIILIFSDPKCGPCSALLPEIARWEKEYFKTLTIVLVSRGASEAHNFKRGEQPLKYIGLQKGREVAAAYQASGTPAAVLIGQDRKIASLLAMGSQAIENLIVTSARVPAAFNRKLESGSAPLPDEPEVGHLAPSIRLPDLNGKLVDLSLFKGRETLVLFWNPSCGFCTKMLSDLRRWEELSSVEAPQLLVVSSGTVEENLAMGLKAPIVIEKDFASGRAFHVRGTPSAVLVDSEGKIASGVAVGAAAVFGLVNAQLSM